MIKVIDKFKRQYLFFPDITIPSASEGEELHYKVNCFGPCKNIEIKRRMEKMLICLLGKINPITHKVHIFF